MDIHSVDLSGGVHHILGKVHGARDTNIVAGISGFCLQIHSPVAKSFIHLLTLNTYFMSAYSVSSTVETLGMRC